MSSWYSGVTKWIDDYIIDPVAETVGYADEIIDDYDETGAIGMTAGEKLVGDIKDFGDSDAFGFIKKGVKAYGTARGIIGKDAKGNQVTRLASKAPKHRVRTLGQMGLRSSGRPVNYSATQTTSAGVGYNNPDIRTAMTTLMNNMSMNQQMNALLAQYTVNPTIGQGRQYSTGKTTISKRKRAVT
jgi:hypothetical protein|tara:strand:+ start:395 stop:949 length:555 start_codon:yes stop_codon:yes gene_type:complete